MQSLSENKMLFRSVALCLGILFLCVTEIFEPINQALQLAPFPSTDELPSSSGVDERGAMVIQLSSSFIIQALGFRYALCLIMLADTIFSFSAERVIVTIFES